MMSQPLFVWPAASLEAGEPWLFLADSSSGPADAATDAWRGVSERPSLFLLRSIGMDSATLIPVQELPSPVCSQPLLGFSPPTLFSTFPQPIPSDDLCSPVSAESDGSLELEEYTYLGNSDGSSGDGLEPMIALKSPVTDSDLNAPALRPRGQRNTSQVGLLTSEKRTTKRKRRASTRAAVAPAVPKRYMCSHCDAKFDRSGVSVFLQRIPANTFVSNELGIASRSQHLSRHSKKHLSPEDKPHKCPVQGCDRAFSRSDNMKTHAKSHIAKLERKGLFAEMKG